MNDVETMVKRNTLAVFSSFFLALFLILTLSSFILYIMDLGAFVSLIILGSGQFCIGIALLLIWVSRKLYGGFPKDNITKITLSLSPSSINCIIGSLDYCGWSAESENNTQNPTSFYALADRIQLQSKEQGHKCLGERNPDVERKIKGDGVYGQSENAGGDVDG